MATAPEAVRAELSVVTATVAAELTAVAAEQPQPLEAALSVLSLVVPPYYDAAGALATAWYEELRDEARPTTSYTPRIIGEASTDWIEREVARFQAEVEAEFQRQAEEDSRQAVLDELVRLAEKEVAAGFRRSITGNTSADQDAIGWSRIARTGACKFCVMLADKGAYFHSESSAIFAAHGNCNCAARPEFRNGEHGPEASVMQYLGAKRERSSKQRAQLRDYLNENYPDAPG